MISCRWKCNLFCEVGRRNSALTVATKRCHKLSNRESVVIGLWKESSSYRRSQYHRSRPFVLKATPAQAADTSV